MFRKIQDKLYSLRDEWKYDFYDCIRDIAEHPVVLHIMARRIAISIVSMWHITIISGAVFFI